MVTSMSDFSLTITAVVTVVTITTYFLLSKMGKGDVENAGLADDYEDKNLTVMLLNASDFMKESDFK